MPSVISIEVFAKKIRVAIPNVPLDLQERTAVALGFTPGSTEAINAENGYVYASFEQTAQPDVIVNNIMSSMDQFDIVPGLIECWLSTSIEVRFNARVQPRGQEALSTKLGRALRITNMTWSDSGDCLFVELAEELTQSTEDWIRYHLSH